MPKPTVIRIPARVRTRFLAHQPITRSITMRLPFLRGRLELALGRYQKVARSHYDLARLEARRHLERDVHEHPGLEIPSGVGDLYAHLPGARLRLEGRRDERNAAVARALIEVGVR